MCLASMLIHIVASSVDAMRFTENADNKIKKLFVVSLMKNDAPCLCYLSAYAFWELFFGN